MADETPAPLSDAEIAAIAERAAKATQGSWHYGDWPGSVYAGAGQHWVADVGRDRDAEDNGIFIAAARTDIPRLLATLAAYREIVAAVAADNGPLVQDRDYCYWECGLCGGDSAPSDDAAKAVHAADCPVTRARALLAPPSQQPAE